MTIEIPTSAEPLARITSVDAWYGSKQILAAVDIAVRERSVLSLFGHNGAGKSTVVKVITGHGVRYRGHVDVPPSLPGRTALGLVPQGEGVFASLTVMENIELGAIAAGIRPKSEEFDRRLEKALEMFPALRAKLRANAGDLSGGQRQMVSIARALLGEPRLLVLDEPSVGLAPLVVGEILEVIRSLADAGTGVLLIEQNIREALRVSDNVVILKSGRVIHESDAAEFAALDSHWDFF